MEKIGELFVYDKFDFIKEKCPDIRYAICELIYESEYNLEIEFLTENIEMSDIIKTLTDQFSVGGAARALIVYYSKLNEKNFRVVDMNKAYDADHIIIDLWS